MTTGEKIAALRKKGGMTQEELAEVLNVSRQSVSRWEMDIAFPETDKLIRLSKIFAVSIDYLLNDSLQKCEISSAALSPIDCCSFIRDCGYFFLATSVDGQPRLRPFGMIYSDALNLFIATERQKHVYSDLVQNPQFEIAAYNLHTHKWIRITGTALPESSASAMEDMTNAYPVLKQKYENEADCPLVIFKLQISNATIF